MKWMSLLAAFAASASFASPCPNRLQYQGGATLKNGTSYYYQNGTRLNSIFTLYFANGRTFKTSGGYFYPNGVTMKGGGGILYYPNGNHLRTASAAFYQDGSRLQSGSTFYYQTGFHARANGKLYNPDGTPSAFPLDLQSSLGAWGSFTVRVTETTDTYTFRFTSLMQDAYVSLVDFSPLAPRFGIRIANGYPNQFVRLTVEAKSGVTACELETESKE